MTKRINQDMELFGFKMRTRRHFFDDRIIRACLDESRDIYRMPKEPKCIIDVGANIGCISLIAARRGANVFAFEPYSENYETLKHNVEVNGYADKINCIKLGVGKPGPTKLYIHPSNSGAVSCYLNQGGLDENVYEDIDVISIQDVFYKYDIAYCDLLKLDCESSENDIIRDLDDRLVARIGQISLEFHDKKLIPELLEILSKWYIPENTKRYEWTFRKK